MDLVEAKKLKAGDMVHHTWLKNKDNSYMRAKVLSVKTWKTRPNEVLVSMKRGMYEYFKYDENEIINIEKGEGR